MTYVASSPTAITLEALYAFMWTRSSLTRNSPLCRGWYSFDAMRCTVLREGSACGRFWWWKLYAMGPVYVRRMMRKTSLTPSQVSFVGVAFQHSSLHSTANVLAKMDADRQSAFVAGQLGRLGRHNSRHPLNQHCHVINYLEERSDLWLFGIRCRIQQSHIFPCCMAPIIVDFHAKAWARFRNRSKTGIGSTSSGCARVL